LGKTRISGLSNQNPSIGDINGDGILDVVVGTTEGHIFAVNGRDGSTFPIFPIKLRGRLQSPPLLVKLNQASNSLHIVVSAYDGHLYLIDGSSGCFEKIDIGESSYSMVLADDINGNGKMDLIVTARSGSVYVLETEAPYHPLRSWTSQFQGRNGFTVRDKYQGVFVTESTRTHRDITGATFTVQFEIIDSRSHTSATYDVKFSIGGDVLLKKQYILPGLYTEVLPCPSKRVYSTIEVVMTNEHKQAFFDSFTISFNVHFYRLLKWILIGPFIIMALVLLFIQDIKTPLPTSVNNHLKH